MPLSTKQLKNITQISALQSTPCVGEARANEPKVAANPAGVKLASLGKISYEPTEHPALSAHSNFHSSSRA